jgi:hypothetical protein
MVRTRSVDELADAEISPKWLAIVASSGVEDRSVLRYWRERSVLRPDVTFLVRSQPREYIDYSIAGCAKVLDLRNANACQAVFKDCESVCIDISGLAHHVWVPLLAGALHVCVDVRVVYAEPQAYRVHPSPASHTVFDLTEGFEGIDPLPGFARLRGPRDESDAIFVPFLGFEGARARHIASVLDPVPPTIPIVGVTGFRIEFPAFTLTCNRDFLSESNSIGRVRFARASCPFEAKRTLEEIRQDNPGAYLYVAPVGTKPHALGAVLHAIERPDSTELMYDYPIRKPQRSTGIGRIHIYSINRT